MRHNPKVLMLDPSGSSVHVSHNLCKELADAGCEVHVFTAPHWLGLLEACGSAVPYRLHIWFYRGTQKQSYTAKNKALKIMWRTIRLLQHAIAMMRIYCVAGGFDVVHTQIMPVPAFDCLVLRLIARRTPVVCTVHELVPHGSKHRRFVGMCFRALYRSASLLYAYTEYTRQRLVEQGHSAQKIVKVPHGRLQHLLQLSETNGERGGANQPPTVLFIGNLRPDKGVDVLIRAAGYIREKVPDVRIEIAGTPGVDAKGLYELVAELGVGDVIQLRLGHLPEVEFAAYLRRAHVLVLPYRRIEQSGVAIAGCTFGKALVATKCGGVEELIKEAGNGLLVPVDDVNALAEAITTLLLSDELRSHYEQKSQIYADEVLGWPNIIEKTLAGYAIVLRPNAKSNRQMAGEEL